MKKSEEEKVKAIHDYLIYSANYVNNGDYQHAEKWASGAGGGHERYKYYLTGKDYK